MASTMDNAFASEKPVLEIKLFPVYLLLSDSCVLLSGMVIILVLDFCVFTTMWETKWNLSGCELFLQYIKV